MVLHHVEKATVRKNMQQRGREAAHSIFRAEYVNTFFSFHVKETSIFLLPKTGHRRVSFRCSFILRCNIEATRDPLPFPGAPPLRFLRFIVIISSSWMNQWT